MKTRGLYLFFLLPITLFAQEFSISGTVKDSNSNTIVYANVVVLRKTDSTIVSGAISNETGNYKIENLLANDYIINASFLGFKTQSHSISLQENKSLNFILNDENEVLGEVEIIVKKPTLKREVDRLVFNIENTSLTEGNIWDVLRSTPGVLILNDEVLVRNSASLIYLINNKRIYLSGVELQQLLSGSAASAVKSVEVITNPPAKYDAEGDAVINIIMSKNLITGYNGSLYSNYTQGVYPRYSAGTSNFFKSKKINLFAGYNFSASKVNRMNKEEINFIENNVIIGNWDTEIDRNTKYKNHNLNWNFDYLINDNNTFSISGNGNITPYWKRTTNSITQAVDSTFNSLNKTEDDKLNLALNADYIYESDKGSKLSFNAHHTNYNYERSQAVSTDYRNQDNTFIRNNSFITLSNQEIRIYSGQTDVKIPIKENGAFEFGFKVSNIDSKSDIDQRSTNSNIEILALPASSRARYRSEISVCSARTRRDMLLSVL